VCLSTLALDEPGSCCTGPVRRTGAFGASFLLDLSVQLLDSSMLDAWGCARLITELAKVDIVVDGRHSFDKECFVMARD
jgi:hypothetical protein